jgi:membrane-associated PAP2 superfamily phosphatase
MYAQISNSSIVEMNLMIFMSVVYGFLFSQGRILQAAQFFTHSLAITLSPHPINSLP